jgi:hypothetical protein
VHYFLLPDGTNPAGEDRLADAQARCREWLGNYEDRLGDQSGSPGYVAETFGRIAGTIIASAMSLADWAVLFSWLAVGDACGVAYLASLETEEELAAKAARFELGAREFDLALMRGVPSPIPLMGEVSGSDWWQEILQKDEDRVSAASTKASEVAAVAAEQYPDPPEGRDLLLLCAPDLGSEHRLSDPLSTEPGARWANAGIAAHLARRAMEIANGALEQFNKRHVTDLGLQYLIDDSHAAGEA